MKIEKVGLTMKLERKEYKMKKKFRVYANSYQRFYVDVVANNKDEAQEIGYNTDGGDFQAVDDGDWEIEGDTIEDKGLCHE